MHSTAESSVSECSAPEARASRLEPAQSHRGPVVLATSGEGAPHVAATIAKRAAASWNVPLHVVSVVPIPVAGDWFTGIAPVPLVALEDGTADRAEEVRKFLSNTSLPMEPYELTIRYGPTLTEITSLVKEVGAELLVVGAAPHLSNHNLRVGDTAVRLLRAVACPVVSALPPLPAQFERVVAAIDFSPASIRAARTALSLMQHGGVLVLLHVRAPQPYLTAVDFEQSARADAENHEKLIRLRVIFDGLAPTGVAVQIESVVGDPEYSILDYAQQSNAQLVSVGTQGSGFFERLFIGSVAESIFHSATCSVLGAREPQAAEAFAIQLDLAGYATSNDADGWARTLSDFTIRNMGRKSRLEIDDPQLGAQTQALGYGFFGVTYDARSNCLTIMLEASSVSRDHLSRSITGASSISIRQDAAKKDIALVVQAGATASILSFLDA